MKRADILSNLLVAGLVVVIYLIAKESFFDELKYIAALAGGVWAKLATGAKKRAAFIAERLQNINLITPIPVLIILAIPAAIGFSFPQLASTLSLRGNQIIVVGDMSRVDAFGCTVREFLHKCYDEKSEHFFSESRQTTSENHLVNGLQIKYLHVDEAIDADPQQLSKFEANLRQQVATHLPLGILSANSSTTVDTLLQQAKKFALPVLIVAATKTGIVNTQETDERKPALIARMLPTNRAQAAALYKVRLAETKEEATARTKLRISLLEDRIKNAAVQLMKPNGRPLIAKRLQEEKENDAVELVRLQQQLPTIDAANPEQLDSPVEEKTEAAFPRVIFGFIHDGSEFATDLKEQFFAMANLGPQLLRQSSILTFECKNELEIVQALQAGQKGSYPSDEAISKGYQTLSTSDGAVCHWFVALYSKAAQQFDRAKSSLESGTPEEERASVTYCDSSYGIWMFPKRINSSVVLPVYKLSETANSSERPYIFPPKNPQHEETRGEEIDGPANENTVTESKQLDTLTDYLPCYGPFAADAISIFANCYIASSQGVGNQRFADVFYNDIIKVIQSNREVKFDRPFYSDGTIAFTQERPTDTSLLYNRNPQFARDEQLNYVNKINESSFEFRLFRLPGS
jgi:hypothetical protein